MSDNTTVAEAFVAMGEALRFYADERNWLNHREIRGFPGFHGRQIAANALAKLEAVVPAEEAPR